MLRWSRLVRGTPGGETCGPRRRTFGAMTAWPAIPVRYFDVAGTPPRPQDDPRVRWLGWATAGPFKIWHKAYRSDFAQAAHAHATGSIDFNIAGSGSGTYLRRPRDSRTG